MDCQDWTPVVLKKNKLNENKNNHNNIKNDNLLSNDEMPEKITVKQLNKLLLKLIGCDLIPDYLTADKSRMPDFKRDIVIIFHYQNEFNYKIGEGIHYSSILERDIPDYEVEQYK